MINFVCDFCKTEFSFEEGSVYMQCPGCGLLYKDMNKPSSIKLLRQKRYKYKAG